MWKQRTELRVLSGDRSCGLLSDDDGDGQTFWRDDEERIFRATIGNIVALDEMKLNA